MLVQLSQGGTEFWNSMSASTVLLTVFFTLLAFAGSWRWAKLVFENDSEPTKQQPMPRWVLRPSNLLFVLGFAVSIYAEVERPSFSIIPMRRARWGIFLLAFVIRYSENRALAGLGDSTRDYKEFDDFPRKDGRLD